MRSLFRRGSEHNTPSPSSPKKGHRLSSILSPNRFKPDNPIDQSQPRQQSLESPIDISAPRPATSPPLNPLPSPEQTPPTNPSLNSQLLSSDGPTLPTSPHQDSSFATSNASAPLDPKYTRSDGFAERNASVSQQARPTYGSMRLQDDPTRYSTHVSQGSTSTRSTVRENMNRSFNNEVPSQTAAFRRSQSVDRVQHSKSASRSSPAETYQTPATRIRPSTQSRVLYSDDVPIDFNDTSFTQSFSRERLSSPSAAAAQRSKMRAASSQAWVDGVASSTRSTSSSQAASARREPRSSEPSRVSSQHLVNKPRPASSGHSRQVSTVKPENITRRPFHLQNHQSSYRSSAHSLLSHESDAAVGMDDMTTNGGRTSGSGLGSRELSRLPSLGSIGSSVSGDTETGRSRGHKRSRSSTLQATTRGNFDRVVENNYDNLPSLDTTPRAKATSRVDPSDTVIAKHVRDVQVPDTVAKRYTALNPDADFNNKQLTTSPYPSKGTTSLSLKEQSAKFDKMEKENFGLKLKIHYLYQALQSRSEEGVTDLIANNVQLQADNLQLKKENQSLRKKIKELERQVEGRFGAASSIAPSYQESEDGVSSRVMEQERGYIQKEMRDLGFSNTKLTGVSAQRQLLDRFEEERSQKEQAWREVDDLKRQLAQLTANTSPVLPIGTRYQTREQADVSRPQSKRSGANSHDTDSLSGNTLVEQLRQHQQKEQEHQQEIQEHQQKAQETNKLLKAQEGMLASHKREKEGLQQQIESMKLLSRRGEGVSPGSTAGDSILDRSVSRAQERSASRASGSTRGSPFSDNERDRIDSAHGLLRDENSMLKMRVQDLQNELNGFGDDVGNVLKLQEERDEAIEALKEADINLETQTADVQQLENMVLERETDIEALEQALTERQGESDAFRAELKKISQEFDEVVGDSENQQATIESLRENIARANGELEMMEEHLRQERSTRENLEVQQESSLSEITFLREEQEADKIKISELHTALKGSSSDSRDDQIGGRGFYQMEQLAIQSREEVRHLRRTLAERETELKQSMEKLDDASATVEEFSANFDGARASYAEDVAKLQQNIKHLTRDLDKAREALSEKDQSLSHRDGLLESSNHETRSLNDLLLKERQGRKHDRNEFERGLHRAKGAPESKFIELERSRDAERQRVAQLEVELNEQTQRRDKLLQSLWNRLSTLSNTEGLAEHQASIDSTSEVSEELPSLMRRLPLTLDTIAAYVASFRTKIRDTERDISQDFQALSEALSERTVRLQNLEAAVAQQPSRGLGTPSAPNEQYMKLKAENKMLKREVKYLKQGSFSLPGLPSHSLEGPTQHDEDPSLPFSQPSMMSTDLEPNKKKDLDTPTEEGMPSPLVHHGPRAKEKSRTTLRQSSALVRARTSADVESLSTVRHYSPHPSDEGRDPRSLSTTNLAHKTTIDGVSDDGSSAAPTTSRKVQQRSSSAQASMLYEPQDKTWLMRLEDMRRRMKVEREGRLLDRDAARKRLVDSEKENNELRAQLRREADRSRFADAGSVSRTGGSEAGMRREGNEDAN